MNRVVKLVDTTKISISIEPTPGVNPYFNQRLLVKVLQCGICGSDLHYFRKGGLGSFKAMPMELGHECVGVVDEPNQNKVFKKGDLVAVEPNLPCGECEYCKMGRTNLCPNQHFLGVNNYIGGMRDYLPVNESQLFKLPKKTNLDFAVMLEPFSVSLYAVEQTLKTNEEEHMPQPKICILGAGPIGVLCAYACFISDIYMENIVLSDINVDRLELARKKIDIPIKQRFKHFYGLKEHIEKKSLKPEITHVIDCAGTQESFDMALKILKPGGKLMLVGIPEVDYLMMNPHIARIKELTILNCRRSNITLKETYTVAKKFQLEKLVTHHWQPEDAEHAFWTLSQYRDNCMKGVIKFG